MGRSTSCFKIITCGSDSVDQDDVRASESKDPSDKRGWSFRKRSARHRVLSNTVITETPSSANKESPESAPVNFQTTAGTSVAEKLSVLQWPDEKPQLPTSVDSTVTETIIVTESENKGDVRVEESVVIAMQAAIRGFLAQKALLKLKNVVKLQAAVRGHLVRGCAVGTLRCVQAIVKMQALVRARNTRLSLQRKEKSDEKHEKDNHSSKSSEKNVSAARPTLTYISIEKLLSNRFARQLLDSTPKGTPIHIKCDPLRSDSSWKWLERWMSVSSPDLVESQRLEFSTEENKSEKVDNSSPQMATEISSELCESADSKSSVTETAAPVESEDNLITYEANNFEFQACRPTSSLFEDNLEQTHPKNFDKADAIEIPLENDILQNQTLQSVEKSETELKSLSEKPEVDSEQTRHSTKRFASEQLETEGKKFVSGSRKASNPSFIAAHSKFEELSSTPNLGRSNSSSNQNVGVDSNIEKNSSGEDTTTRTKEADLTETAVPHYSRVQVGGSECGTELSISSTLDSPDRSDIGAVEFEHEAKVSKDGGAYIPSKTENLDVEAKDMSTIPVSNFSDSMTVKPDKLETINGNSIIPVVAVESVQLEQKPERSPSDLQIELEYESGHQAYRSSPEASPRSHITVPESQGTPSSQVSTIAKQVKADRSGSSQKRKSMSAGKKSPSNALHDSGARNSVEQLSKDQKAGKRRNSFGSPRPDNVDQEQRDSTSGNFLPSYMQATESARAKANANNSPRSSPDVLDKDIYIKKRHSLPGANGRQRSPRIQRSTSQVQQGAKGNGTQPERKWQR